MTTHHEYPDLLYSFFLHRPRLDLRSYQVNRRIEIFKRCDILAVPDVGSQVRQYELVYIELQTAGL